MKNLLVLAILLVPMLSFGQLKKKDKKAVEQYADQMCGCVNDLMATLNPQAVEFIMLIGTEGDEAGEAAIIEYVGSASEEDVKVLLESFNVMGSDEFQGKIEKCDLKTDMSDEVSGSIDAAMGDGYDYFYKYLGKDDGCSLFKILLDAGTDVEEAESAEE